MEGKNGGGLGRRLRAARFYSSSHQNQKGCSMHHNSLFLSSKISTKIYSREIIFRQTKFTCTSCVWWALIEEIAPHAKEMAGEKEIACCVRGYWDIWAAVLVCSTEPTNIRKIFVIKLYSCKTFSHIFCVRKYFYNENRANYGNSYWMWYTVTYSF